jgi:CBS domain-containing protein
MKIKDFMKKNVVSVSAKTSILAAASMIVDKKVGTLPVVDEQGKPVGVVRLKDLLALEMPDFINLIKDFDYVHDFGAVETTRPTHDVLAQSVTTIMQPVITIEEESGLLRAYATMLQDEISDLPVKNSSGILVGVVSLVDVGRAILSMWSKD